MIESLKFYFKGVADISEKKFFSAIFFTFKCITSENIALCKSTYDLQSFSQTRFLDGL